jgi:hypothetical protein
MALVFRRRITFKHAFEEHPSLTRTTGDTPHVADEPIRDEYKALVASAASDLGEPPHCRSGRTAFPGGKFHGPLRPERPQLSLDIIHALREFPRLRHNRPGPIDRPHCQNQRNRKGDVQSSLERRTEIETGRKDLHRTLSPLTTFDDER